MAGETEAATNFLSQAIQIASNYVSEFVSLVGTNWWYIVAILVIMYAESYAIDYFRVPFLKGNLRWIALFFITMAVSAFWQPIVTGVLPHA